MDVLLLHTVSLQNKEVFNANTNPIDVFYIICNERRDIGVVILSNETPTCSLHEI